MTSYPISATAPRCWDSYDGHHPERQYGTLKSAVRKRQKEQKKSIIEREDNSIELTPQILNAIARIAPVEVGSEDAEQSGTVTSLLGLTRGNLAVAFQPRPIERSLAGHTPARFSLLFKCRP